MPFNTLSLTVACVVAHPDDEVLLCGGSLARHARAGHRVETLILATGLDARGKADTEAHAIHVAAAKDAAKRLGIAQPRNAGLPDNQLDSVPLLQVIKEVERFFAEVKPELVYTHHRGDLNIDHRVTHDAVLTAARPVEGCPVKRIVAGETLSSTEWHPPGLASFTPNVFHDITETLDAKVAALEAYAGEVRPYPHPRSREALRALATYRGAQSGFHAGEAFLLVRDRV